MKRLIGLCLLLCSWAGLAQANPARAIPLPSAGGDKGIHVRETQQALRALGYLEGELEGLFDAHTMLALLTYQQEMGLLPSGEADVQTLRLLFTPPAPKQGDTLRPYWYGGGSDAVPVGARFHIKDVRSGIIFECVRVMGLSHLDAEPVTAADTALMLEAYGGRWAWDRRPILLSYLGQIYAASMNGKPHGWEVIPGNDMTGHFCVHFFGSRGDGSQRVDPDHLACAIEAGVARWE